jgi:hypothetical protein
MIFGHNQAARLRVAMNKFHGCREASSSEGSDGTDQNILSRGRPRNLATLIESQCLYRVVGSITITALVEVEKSSE